VSGLGPDEAAVAEEDAINRKQHVTTVDILKRNTD
jgi:hypothetical protein